MANRAADTALGPMAVVAMEQGEPVPLLRDELAERIVPGSVRPLVLATRWPPLRRSMMRGVERGMPGLWASMLCRKRYVEDRLREAVDAGVGAVVVLGAGLDTLAYRLPEVARLPVFEVDQPVNVERKRARLTALFGQVPHHVTLVPVDFGRDDLGAALARHGYRADRTTFFAWEAVTQYLTEAAVRDTFGFLSGAAPGSRLVFTYIRRDFLDATELYGAEAAHRKYVRTGLWRFGLCPEQVGEFLDEFGWAETEQAGPAEFADRYLRPAHRSFSASEIERSVSAGKPG